MTAGFNRPLLARLRSSARLTVLVLLVFALKIGTAAAACAQHEFADLGLGGEANRTVVTMVAGDSGDADLPGSQLGHAGKCTHGSCHQAAALVPAMCILQPAGAQEATVFTTGPPASAARLLELRPPIA